MLQCDIRTEPGRRHAIWVLVVIAMGSFVASPAIAPASVIDDFEAQGAPLTAPQLGSGWVGYPADYALRDSTAKLIEGARDGDGCAFEVETVASDAIPSQEVRERAYNDEHCIALVEVGRLPEQVELIAQQQVSPQSSSATTEAVSCGNGSVDGAAGEACDATNVAPLTDPDYSGNFIEAGYGAGADGAPCSQYEPCAIAPAEPSAIRTRSGYHEAAYEDPVSIDVAQTRTHLSWAAVSPGPGCVEGANGSATNNPYEPTGWGVISTNTYWNYDCANAWASTYSYFANSHFCEAVFLGFQPTTKVFFDRNRARGYQSGILRGTTRAIKKGGCKFLLSFESRSIRTT